MKRAYWVLIFVALLGASLALTGCSSRQTDDGKVDIQLAPPSVLPAHIQQAPTTVKEAYQFAVANQDLVSQFPCYCGCGSMGHESNLSCYVQQVQPDGGIIFDDHAFG